MKKKFSCIMAMLLCAALLAVGCGSGGDGGGGDKNKVVVASKAHTEQFILGEILALMIENNSDIEVVRKIGMNGASDIIHAALLEGEIDMYPEYTGTGWLNVLGKDPESDPDKMYEGLQEEYGNIGLTWLGLYGFNNTYALTMRTEQADALGFTKVSDLKGHPELTFGANPDYMERPDGYPGLCAFYDLTFGKTFEVTIALKYQALENGDCDVINGFSTDAMLNLPQYKVLADDLGYFTSYYAGTIVRSDTLKKYPELKDVLAKLDDNISEEEMIAMNYAVEVDGQDYEKVARDFLVKKGLIEEAKA